MRFDLEAFRQALPQGASVSLPTLFAGGGVALAALVVAYGALSGAGEGSAEVDAVAAAGPMFTPVAVTPVATRDTGASEADVPASPHFDDATSITRAVQRELKRAGCYGGPINGVWTAATRAAMGEFTARVNARLPVDRADPVLLALIETNDEVSCGTGAAPPQPRAEVAGVETTWEARRREELHTSSVSAPPNADGARARYSDEDRRALDTLASADEDADAFDAPSATGAAAVAAAAASAAAPKVTKPERRRTSRKYKRQPSVARQVSRGFRSLQRSLNKLF